MTCNNGNALFLVFFSFKDQSDNTSQSRAMFPNLFWFAAPHILFKIFDGTPDWFNRYKDKENEKNGGTPDISSRNPGWESLF